MVPEYFVLPLRRDSSAPHIDAGDDRRHRRTDRGGRDRRDRAGRRRLVGHRELGVLGGDRAVEQDHRRVVQRSAAGGVDAHLDAVGVVGEQGVGAVADAVGLARAGVGGMVGVDRQRRPVGPLVALAHPDEHPALGVDGRVGGDADEAEVLGLERPGGDRRPQRARGGGRGGRGLADGPPRSRRASAVVIVVLAPRGHGHGGRRHGLRVDAGQRQHLLGAADRRAGRRGWSPAGRSTTGRTSPERTIAGARATGSSRAHGRRAITNALLGEDGPTRIGRGAGLHGATEPGTTPLPTAHRLSLSSHRLDVRPRAPTGTWRSPGASVGSRRQHRLPWEFTS